MAKKYKRRFLIIDPAFQIRTTLILCASTAVFFVILDAVIIMAIKSHLEGLNLNPVIYQDFFRKLIIYQVAILFVFLAFQFFALLMFTHKIAGPIVKVKKILDNILSGNRNDNTRFREGDFFYDAADKLTDLDLMLTRHDEELDKVTHHLDKVFSTLSQEVQSEGHIIRSQVQSLKIFDKI